MSICSYISSRAREPDPAARTLSSGVQRTCSRRCAIGAQVMRLTDLDDRALKDIGLLRADVEGALLEPLHKDPSKVLSVRRPEPRPRARPAGVNEPRLAPRHACCV